MGTIELDTSNPAPFENFVSQNERKKQTIALTILAGALIAYIVYTVYEDFEKKRRYHY